MEVRSTIAIDWSGARADGPRRTWLAEVGDGRLAECRNGWTPDSLVDWLIARAERDPAFVAGLDFAFGYPGWFVRERFGGSPFQGWQAGEALLSEEPFWGRPGRRRPPLDASRPHLRRTEAAVTTGRPKSIFQVGGAGSVGTGSLRGMPVLTRLRKAGFAIWPFDPPGMPLVLEIYPRALTGPVVKRVPAARRAYLERLRWPADAATRSLVASSEDALDAAVSAPRLFEHREEFSHLPDATDVDRVEGRIWLPAQPWTRSYDVNRPLALEWSEVAADWIAWARAPGHDSYWRFHRDRFLELLPEPPGEVLDLGCGEGRLCRDLKARGYHTIGIDASPQAIAAARAADPGGRYEIADAASTGLPAASVDVVAALMSLQDIDDLTGAVAEATRVLRPGGRLCAATVHPLNSAGRFESQEPDAAFRLEGPYLAERRYVDRGGRAGLRMRFSSVHRPLGAYFAAVEQQGMLVDRLREVTVDAESVEARADRGRWLGVPLFLHVRARKPGP